MEGVGRGEAINLVQRMALISEHWRPTTVATVNDYDVRLARMRGEYLRHQHPDSDEFFLVIDGELTIDLDERAVQLRPGDVYVVAAGKYHRLVAHVETSVLLFQPHAVDHMVTARGLTSRRADL